MCRAQARCPDAMAIAHQVWRGHSARNQASCSGAWGAADCRPPNNTFGYGFNSTYNVQGNFVLIEGFISDIAAGAVRIGFPIVAADGSPSVLELRGQVMACVRHRQTTCKMYPPPSLLSEGSAPRAEGHVRFPRMPASLLLPHSPTPYGEKETVAFGHRFVDVRSRLQKTRPGAPADKFMTCRFRVFLLTPIHTHPTAPPRSDFP